MRGEGGDNNRIVASYVNVLCITNQNIFMNLATIDNDYDCVAN